MPKKKFKKKKKKGKKKKKPWNLGDKYSNFELDS